ncbi:MAG TPA: hypothetical protein VK745_22295 [Polyangiaceae bacterium]|nr:hypothetical protein [Polyangiaceae bacterium]
MAAAVLPAATFVRVHGARQVVWPLADNDVEFAKTAGLFLDRNESLLASVQVTNVLDYFIRFNLYPNVFAIPQLGRWAVVDKGGHCVTGVSFTQALGVGVGIGTLGK